MGWTPFAEAEDALGSRLHRKLASGALPAYTDGCGRRWVWTQEGSSTDDVLWEVLAELRRLRESLTRLEAQVEAQGQPAADRRTTTSAPEAGGRIVSMTTGAWRRLESALLDDDDPEAEAA